MLRVYGASDDLIEIDGEISEEFTCAESEAVLAFSDGTLLGVTYDDDGCWRIVCRVKGSATYDKVEAAGVDAPKREDGTPGYSDVVSLHGEIGWVALVNPDACTVRRQG